GVGLGEPEREVRSAMAGDATGDPVHHAVPADHHRPLVERGPRRRGGSGRRSVERPAPSPWTVIVAMTSEVIVRRRDARYVPGTWRPTGPHPRPHRLRGDPMRPLIVTAFVSADGVVEAPGRR